MNWGLADDGYDWAQRFSAESTERMLTAPAEFAALDGHGEFRRAVPTPDHFIPAVYFAGLAGASPDPRIDVLVDGYAYGSLSMTAFTLDVSCDVISGGAGAPQPPGDLSPDASNI